MRRRVGIWLLFLPAVLIVLGSVACSATESFSEGEIEVIKETLDGRSFRQFDDSVDSDPRKTVIIDFTGGVELWAQYVEAGSAIDEWRISAEEYRIDDVGDHSNITLYLENPRSERTLTEPCQDCIPMENISISVRNVLHADEIQFRINDPDGVLPSPFPVFTSWTRFIEDELFE